MSRRAGLFCRVAFVIVMTLALTPVIGTQTVSAQTAAPAGDPSGAATGTAKDVPVKDAAAPTLPEVMDTVGHNKIAINFVWTLVCGFLVMFMQAGFAMVETGFCRAKNAAHTMSMNFMIYPIGMIGYWICGFALAVRRRRRARRSSATSTAPLNHEVHDDAGRQDAGAVRRPRASSSTGDTYDVGIFALFLFQMVFMDTAATIPTGAMAERWKLSAFVAFGFFMSMVVYPIFGNWVWGGGWLATLGSQLRPRPRPRRLRRLVGGPHGRRRARRSPAPLVIGPRIGKFNKDGTPHAMPGHHHADGHRSARSSCASAGSGSTRARRWPAPTCASA